MTTDQQPIINLSPDAVQERTPLRSLYMIKEAQFARASDEYMANRPNDTRPLQLQIVWVGKDFRFSSNPDKDPEMIRSINVTDKNGNPMVWGTKNPEPSSDDAFPVQISKYFALLGVVIETDPHVLDGKWFWGEQKELTAGNMKITTIVPVEVYTGPVPYAGEVRLVQVKGESGQAGHPATGAAQTPQVSKQAAAAALAVDMAGKNKTDVVAVALGNDTVKQCAELLSELAIGDVSALEEFGTFDEGGVFNTEPAVATA